MKKPSEIPVDVVGCVVDTLGKFEAEAAAAVLVLYMREHGDEWQPVTGRTLSDWLANSELVKKMARNPFWQPDPMLLKRSGLVLGWEHPDDPIIVTERLIELLSTPMLHRTAPRRVLDPIEPEVEANPEPRLQYVGGHLTRAIVNGKSVELCDGDVISIEDGKLLVNGILHE